MYLLVVAFYGVSPQDILRDMREYLELDAIVLEADVSEFFRPEDAYYFSSFQENVDVGDIESAVRNLRRLVDLPYIPTDLKTYLLIQESRYLTGLKRQDEAIQVLNDIASIYPQDVEVQIMCDAAIGTTMIESVGIGGTYNPSMRSIRAHYERFFNSIDYFHPHIIWAHINYARYLMWFAQTNVNIEFADLAITHLNQALSLLEEAREQLDPLTLKHYRGLLDNAQATTNYNLPKYHIDKERILLDIEQGQEFSESSTHSTVPILSEILSTSPLSLTKCNENAVVPLGTLGLFSFSVPPNFLSKGNFAIMLERNTKSVLKNIDMMYFIGGSTILIVVSGAIIVLKRRSK